MTTIGIDEVGRGSWAGPLLVVAARSTGKLPIGLHDSKALSATQRKKLIESIRKSCQLGEGWVSSEEIDEFGLSRAMRMGVQRALQELDASNYEQIIIDGPINYCPTRFQNVHASVKADSVYPVVSAASIYAKVLRDDYMKMISSQYPEYLFEKHVGYGTMLHSLALTKNGACGIHRKSFKPVKALVL